MPQLQFFTYPGFGEFAAKELHYSQAVRIGDTIEISGQGGWNPLNPLEPKIVIPADIQEEVVQTFKNVEAALKAAGGDGWSQVYSVRAYILELSEENIQIFSAVLKEYAPNHQPLVTGVGVNGLAFPGMRLEIEVKAYLGKWKHGEVA